MLLPDLAAAELLALALAPAIPGYRHAPECRALLGLAAGRTFAEVATSTGLTGPQILEALRLWRAYRSPLAFDPRARPTLPIRVGPVAARSPRHFFAAAADSGGFACRSSS